MTSIEKARLIAQHLTDVCAHNEVIGMTLFTEPASVLVQCDIDSLSARFGDPAPEPAEGYTVWTWDHPAGFTIRVVEYDAVTSAPLVVVS